MLENIKMDWINGASCTLIRGTDTGQVTEDQNLKDGNYLITSGRLSTDDRGGFIEKSQKGTYGTLTLDGCGRWLYKANNNQASIQSLGAGECKLETFTIKSSDGTKHKIQITIKGVNDTAEIGGVDTGSVTEDLNVSKGNFLETKGLLKISDVDNGEAFFKAGSQTSALGTLTLNKTGQWDYKASNAQDSIQDLKAGESIFDAFTIKSQDGTTHEIKITINGADESLPNAKISGTDSGTVTEDTKVTNGNLIANGKLNIVDLDLNESSFIASSQKGNLGTLTLKTDGNWDYAALNDQSGIQSLGAKDETTDIFTIKSADGTQHQITLTIKGVNDKAEITGVDKGSVTEDLNPVNGFLITKGKLEISDDDTGEASFKAETQNSKLGSLTLDAVGNWEYKVDNNLAQIQSLTLKSSLQEFFDIESVDGTQHQITLTINGAADQAKISGIDTGSVTEDTKVSGDNLTASGKLEITDLDLNEAFFIPDAQKGSLGTLTLSKDGSWDYEALNTQTEIQSLGAGAKTQDVFTIQSVDGTQHKVTLTINGINDKAEITGIDKGSVTEDLNPVNGFLITTGKLEITDVDTGEASFKAGTQNSKLGSLTLDTVGNWEYKADNSQSGIQSLGAKVSLQEVFDIQSVDGTQHQITLTINGANDAALIGGKLTGSITEDTNVSKTGTLTAGGTLTITDVDTGEAAFVKSAQTSALGKFSLDATTGVWAYEADNKNATIQALNLNQSLVDTFTIQSIDGTQQQIKITINGANEVPPIVLDLNHDGKITLISCDDSDVTINSNLALGWVGPEDGILVYDPMGQGKVTDIKQFSLASYTEADDTDLESMAIFDTNHDLKFDQHDEAFSDFGVWQDKNGNGVVDDGEYATLIERGITSISLVSDHNSEIVEGNTIHGYTLFEMADGKQYKAADVELKLQAIVEEIDPPQSSWYDIFTFSQEPLG